MKTTLLANSNVKSTLLVIILWSAQMPFMMAYLMTRSATAGAGIIAVQIAGSLVLYNRNKQWLAKARPAKGRVAYYQLKKYRRKNGHIRIRAVFGLAYLFHTTPHTCDYMPMLSSSKLMVGSTVGLLYNPNNPNDIRLSQDRWLLTRFLIAMTTLWTLFFLYFFT